jgi:ribosomal protein S18 acetylase RimI-like enzyme
MQTDVRGKAEDLQTAEKPKGAAGESSPPLLIRPISAADREPILRILVETGMFTDQEVSIALELLDTVLTQPEQQDYVINVCEIVGPVGYYCIGPTPATVGTFDLYWIAVDPVTQGRGIGAALVAHAEGVVRDRGGRLILAETSSQAKYQGTREFYRRRGYDQLTLIRDYYSPGDDLIVFGKYIH